MICFSLNSAITSKLIFLCAHRTTKQSPKPSTVVRSVSKMEERNGRQSAAPLTKASTQTHDFNPIPHGFRIPAMTFAQTTLPSHLQGLFLSLPLDFVQALEDDHSATSFEITVSESELVLCFNDMKVSMAATKQGNTHSLVQYLERSEYTDTPCFFEVAKLVEYVKKDDRPMRNGVHQIQKDAKKSANVLPMTTVEDTSTKVKKIILPTEVLSAPLENVLLQIIPIAPQLRVELYRIISQHEQKSTFSSVLEKIANAVEPVVIRNEYLEKVDLNWPHYTEEERIAVEKNIHAAIEKRELSKKSARKRSLEVVEPLAPAELPQASKKKPKTSKASTSSAPAAIYSDDRRESGTNEATKPPSNKKSPSPPLQREVSESTTKPSLSTSPQPRGRPNGIRHGSLETDDSDAGLIIKKPSKPRSQSPKPVSMKSPTKLIPKTSTQSPRQSPIKARLESPQKTTMKSPIKRQRVSTPSPTVQEPPSERSIKSPRKASTKTPQQSPLKTRPQSPQATAVKSTTKPPPQAEIPANSTQQDLMESCSQMTAKPPIEATASKANDGWLRPKAQNGTLSASEGLQPHRNRERPWQSVPPTDFIAAENGVTSQAKEATLSRLAANYDDIYQKYICLYADIEKVQKAFREANEQLLSATSPQDRLMFQRNIQSLYQAHKEKQKADIAKYEALHAELLSLKTEHKKVQAIITTSTS